MNPYRLDNCFPCMGVFDTMAYKPITLSNLNFEQEEDVQQKLNEYLIAQKGGRENPLFLFGGYLEKRSFYTSSTLFKKPSENRNIHLGIDVWADAGIPVYAAGEGVIHSFANNNNMLDYGYTIIVRYPEYFVLYGHLSKSSLESLFVGKPVKRGEQIATLGTMKENGGWVPHLHIQIITHLDHHEGDFPGLCTEANIAFYSHLCPNPLHLVLSELFP